jgi:hypothetical protein
LHSGASTWLLPSFLVPKKDDRVRYISNSQKLNKHIKRKIDNLPMIRDILTCRSGRSGYKYFTKLDTSRQYYTFEFDEFNKKLCTNLHIAWYCYHQLPMGVSQTPKTLWKIIR